MPVLHVIIASTREGRQGKAVADWAFALTQSYEKFDVELIDLAEVNLPLLDEPNHPRSQKYQHEPTKRWSAIVSRADAFVVVMPEYDYFPPASMVNALQCLAKEWEYKPMGFVSYGGVAGGTRSVQALKPLCTTLKIVPIPEQAAIPFFTQHMDTAIGVFNPGKLQEDAVRVMLDELLRWTNALAVLRAPR